MQRFGGKEKVLAKLYPEQVWDMQKFIFGSRFAQQKQLLRVIQQLYPSHQVEDEWPPADSEYSKVLVFKQSRAPMKFDIAIPALKLCSMCGRLVK